MMLFIISLTAFLASLLTLFSGFGLGTLLMPVAALFMPVAAAVALTAFVHLVNNLFKLFLLRRHVDWPVVMRFGFPALLAAFPGAWLLSGLAELPSLHVYSVAGIIAVITPVKLVVGLLLILFATLEWLPVFRDVRFSPRTLTLGGLLSGFFGGLSGHQGAFRAIFLIRAGLDKNQFVASSAAIASLVDLARLIVYGLSFSAIAAAVNPSVVMAATIAALAGALAGTFWLEKMTISLVQKIVAAMLYVLGILLVSGLI